MNFFKKIHDILYKFVWDGPAKIKHSVMTKDYVEGGIKDDRYSEFQYNYEIKMDEENSCQL